MADIEGTAGLDLSEALSAVDDLAASLTSALGDAISGVSDQLATSLGSIADAVPPIDVAVTADASAATAAVDDVVAKADAEHPVIPVDADTTDAQAAIDDLAASAEDATTALDTGSASTKSFADSNSLLSGAAGLAVGNVSGLGEAATGAGLGAGTAAVGVAALGAGVFELFNKGIDATSALQRFNFIVGDMADRVLNVHVGTLNAQLDELAIKLGTDDEALRNANASIFQFAVNSGSSRAEAARFSNEVTALAARAIALNPALGTVATAAESLEVRLSRGGRFAAQYGLSLTAAEINARALANTSKDSAADLTIYEKSAAAAQIAVERYGNSLGTTVAQGAKNATIEQRSLKEQLDNVLEAAGKPLVTPFLAAFKESLPAVKELASTLGEVAIDALPVFVGGLQAVVPLLQIVGTAVETVTSVTDELGVTSTATGAAIGFAFGGPVGAAIGALGGLISDMGGFADAEKEAADNLRVLVREINNLSGAKLVKEFEGAATVRALADGVSVTTARLREFKDVAETNATAARKLLDAMEAAGVPTAGLERILAGIIKGHADSAAAADKNRAATDALKSSTADLDVVLQGELKIMDELINRQLGVTGAAINYEQAVKDQNTAQDEYNAVLNAYGKEAADASDAGTKLESANLKTAQSAIALDKAQTDLNTDLADPIAVSAALSHLRDLQNQYPAAAAALQPYVDKLQEQADKLAFLKFLGDVHNTVTADTSQAVESIDALTRAYGNLGAAAQAAGLDLGPEAVAPTGGLDLALQAFLAGIPNVAAEGAVVPARPGGSAWRLGEAGSTEVVLSQGNTDAENLSLLSRAGLSRLVAQQPTLYAPALTSVGAPSGGPVDNSTVINVDARGQDDPARIGIAIARQHRAQQSLAAFQ